MNHKIGDVDLRHVITDRPPPVRKDPPSFDPPPIPTLAGAAPRVQMKTIVHSSDPAPERREAPEPLSPEALAWFADASIAPTERLIEPPPRPRTWGHPGLWVLAAFFAAAALTAALALPR